MTDVVVTVPAKQWEDWIAEGQLPGEPWDGKTLSYFSVPMRPRIAAGERVYVVAGGRLRGYAPLLYMEGGHWRGERAYLVRGPGAVAVTIDDPIPGFRGYRYRWWVVRDERPFPDWQTL